MAKGRDLRPQQESARDKFAREMAERNAASRSWDGRDTLFDPNDRSDGWQRRTATARQQALDDAKYGNGGDAYTRNQRKLAEGRHPSQVSSSGGFSSVGASSSASGVNRAASGGDMGGSGLRAPVNFEQLKASTMATMARGGDLQQRIADFRSRMGLSGGSSSAPQASNSGASSSIPQPENSASESAPATSSGNSFGSTSSSAGSSGSDWRSIAMAKRAKMAGAASATNEAKSSPPAVQDASAPVEEDSQRARTQRDVASRLGSVGSYGSYGGRSNSLA